MSVSHVGNVLMNIVHVRVTGISCLSINLSRDMVTCALLINTEKGNFSSLSDTKCFWIEILVLEFICYHQT